MSEPNLERDPPAPRRGVSLLFVLSAPAFLLLGWAVRARLLLGLDRASLQLGQRAPHWLKELGDWFTFLGDAWLEALLVTLVGLALWHGGSQRPAAAPVLFLLTALVEGLTKLFLLTPGTLVAGLLLVPPAALPDRLWALAADVPVTDYPSGHVGRATVLLGLSLWWLRPRMRGRTFRIVTVATLLLAALMGITRMAVGLHDMSDVIGGYLLGLAVLGLALQLVAAGRRPEGMPRRRRA